MNASTVRSRFENFQDKDFRPGQQETIRQVVDSGRKVTVIQAPTGSGKSLIGMCLGAMHERCCYLCSTKQLQRQLVHDFPEARHMMGRNNFPCNQDPGSRTADLCIHTSSTPCSLKSTCNYEVHKRHVLTHPLQILNYHYILNEANYVGQFVDYPLVVCDEADVLEGLLTSFIELRITRCTLYKLNLQPPLYRTSTAKDGLSSWKHWAEGEARVKIARRLSELDQHVCNLNPTTPFTEEDARAVKEKRSLEALHSKLSAFVTHMDESWIFQELKDEYKDISQVNTWVFQPTWLTEELSRQYFWRHGEKFVLMSATFPPKAVLAEMLGLPGGDMDMIELPSSFPAANRPVYLSPVADMAHKVFNDNLPKLLDEIEKILTRHRDEKGIIHTVSWRLNQAVMSLNNPRLITHNTWDKDAKLREFADSDAKVLVSPSSTRGVDLPDDMCRFVVIAKAPFQNLGDKLVSSRVYGSGLGSFWYRAICAQDIVQASGRGVRHKDDYCTTYLLDKQIEKLVVDNQNLFPRYWMEAVDYL